MRGPVLFAAAVAVLGSLPRGWTGEPPGAAVILHVSSTVVSGEVPEAMPARFVLLDDDDVYVGGTNDVAFTRLDRGDVKRIEKDLERVRKIPGLGARVAFGSGATTYRLTVRKGRPLDVTATGDPASAPPGLRPLAALMAQLATFDHPSLRPYRPAFYAVSAREGRLSGGCRAWSFPVPLAQALASPQPLAASLVEDWPTGASAASVCVGDKSYAVTLRPLLPGEKP